MQFPVFWVSFALFTISFALGIASFNSDEWVRHLTPYPRSTPEGIPRNQTKYGLYTRCDRTEILLDTESNVTPSVENVDKPVSHPFDPFMIPVPLGDGGVRLHPSSSSVGKKPQHPRSWTASKDDHPKALSSQQISALLGIGVPVDSSSSFVRDNRPGVEKGPARHAGWTSYECREFPVRGKDCPGNENGGGMDGEFELCEIWGTAGYAVQLALLFGVAIMICLLTICLSSRFRNAYGRSSKVASGLMFIHAVLMAIGGFLVLHLFDSTAADQKGLFEAGSRLGRGYVMATVAWSLDVVLIISLLAVGIGKRFGSNDDDEDEEAVGREDGYQPIPTTEDAARQAGGPGRG